LILLSISISSLAQKNGSAFTKNDLSNSIVDLFSYDSTMDQTLMNDTFFNQNLSAEIVKEQTKQHKVPDYFEQYVRSQPFILYEPEIDGEWLGIILGCVGLVIILLIIAPAIG
jgi:hypothetical protein